MTKEIEFRIKGGQFTLERRADGDGDGDGDGGAASPRLAGYAAVFDQPTDVGGFFVERIERGAFADALGGSDVHALFNHNEDLVLGRAKAGTLVLAEDEHGLHVEISPPDTQDARDLLKKVERGDIDQMSFAFTMRGGAEEWDDTQDPPIRTIKKVGEIFDVSVVTRGAYPTTEVAVRALEAFRKDEVKEARASAYAFRARRKMDLGLKARRAGRSD